VSKKKALITGVTGQDGAYLARLLLQKGYEVHGMKRRASSFNTQRVDGIYADPHDENAQFFMHYGDMTDSSNIMRLVQNIEPDEIYNLAAQSHVQVSFETAEYTANADAFGTLRFLEAIRTLGLVEKTRFYQARRQSFTAKCKKCRKVKPRRFIHEAPMPSPNFMPIGFASIIAKLMAFMPPMAFCSTMKVQCAAKRL